MSADRVPVLITSPLERELVARIAAVDPRLDVRFPADLIPAPAYHADHATPGASTPELAARWRALLSEAEILFDFGPGELVEELRSLPRLRWIQATSAGVGQFAARSGLTRSEIVVTTASGIHGRPLAEYVLMAILMFAKEALRLIDDQRAHRWERYATAEIAGSTVGIVGVGRIGREVARAVRVFDARVIGTVRAPAGRRAGDLFLDRLLPPEAIDEVVAAADYLVLCCPHTPQTERLIDERRLALMKQDAVLINIARGAIVDEPALIAALQAGRLRGAALDVFAREPLPDDSPLWDMPSVLISPHSVSTDTGENSRIADLFCDNLRRYLDGQPLRNVLQNDLLY